MQAGVSDIESETIAEQFVELLNEERAAFGVNFPHSPDVAQVKPLRNETRQGRLIDSWRVLVDDGAKLGDRVDKGRGNEQVSQAQRGIKDLAHGAGVDNTAAIIEPL